MTIKVTRSALKAWAEKKQPDEVVGLARERRSPPLPSSGSSKQPKPAWLTTTD